MDKTKNIPNGNENANNTKSKQKYGVINSATKELIEPCEYDKTGLFREGLAQVKLNEKYGFIDKNGNIIVDFKYDDVDNFSEGLAQVELNEKYGFIDKNGNVVIDIKYDSATSFTPDFAFVELENERFRIDKQGNMELIGASKFKINAIKQEENEETSSE